MSNRVEELESKVSELQAAVNGLTEELVEMKERVRELEDDRDVAVAGGASRAASTADAGSETGGDGEPNTEPVANTDAAADAEGADADPRDKASSDSEILEPTPTSGESGQLAHDQEPEAGDDDVKGKETEGKDNDGESDESDIIVA